MIASNTFFRFGAWARVALLACGLVPLGFCQQKSGSPAIAQPSPSTEAAPKSAQAKAVFIVRGMVKAGSTPLPGATVTASNTLTGKKTSAATDIDGSYSLTLPSRGRYVIKAELAAFAPSTKEVVITPAAPQQQQSAGATQQIAAALANRGMQSLSLSGETTNAGESGDTAGAQNLGGLPLNGAGAEGPTESVAITGAMGQAQNFGMNPDEMEDRIQEFRERTQREA